MERPYLFYVGEEEVKMSLGECLKRVIVNRERTLPVIYKPQAMFRSDTGFHDTFGDLHIRSSVFSVSVCNLQ